MEKQKLSVYVSEQAKLALRVEAARTGAPLTVLVENILLNYLKSKGVNLRPIEHRARTVVTPGRGHMKS